MTFYALANKHNDDGSENELRWVKPVHTEVADLCTKHEGLFHATTDGLRQCGYAFGMEFDHSDPCQFQTWFLVRIGK